jgi:predicted transcriptional regulator
MDLMNRKIQKATLQYKDKQTSPVVSMVKLNKVDEKVVATLQAENKELSLQELADKTGEPSKKVFKSLKKLFENEIVSTMARKYKLTITDSKAIKAKLAAKADEEEPAD